MGCYDLVSHLVKASINRLSELKLVKGKDYGKEEIEYAQGNGINHWT